MTVFAAFVDRIEGQMAVLLIEGRQDRIVLSRALLPDGAVEGTALSISIGTDSAATEAARRRVQDLIDELGNEK